MKILANNKSCDVQNTEFGIVVMANGKYAKPGSRTYEIAVSEFKRISEDNAYAAREAVQRRLIELGGEAA